MSCFSDGTEKYLFVIYLDGVFSVWNANQKKVATSHPDYSFIAYDQLIKISWLSKSINTTRFMSSHHHTLAA